MWSPKGQWKWSRSETIPIWWSQKYFKNQQEFLGQVNGQVEELYGGHVVVQAFNGEEDSIKEFNKINNKLYESAWKSQFLSSTMQPIMMFVGNLSYVVVSILGGYLVIKNKTFQKMIENKTINLPIRSTIIF